MYDAELRQLAHQCGRKLGLGEDCLHEGIYFHTAGPAYETAAMGRMSTTPETIVGRHLNMKIFAISLITDTTNETKKSAGVLTHAEVLRVANERAPVLARLVEKMLTCL
ncbi:unnamed protein product [Dibothriocephalus latus]|uniref:purine-nucleoside phosphorylase n=1 Tax=Dibothriocephalus latus TaxID=60516 RepID=A0A3P7RKV3_DIBLA|nr:unnamed protein product [Dibothriocephalus latus]